MSDRHKSKPKAVRMPDGLEAWYRKRAAETGQSLNAAIVAALEDYRGRHGTDTLTSMGTARPSVLASLAGSGTVSAVAPGPQECAHERLRMAKGVCPDCMTYVESKPKRLLCTCIRLVH